MSLQLPVLFTSPSNSDQSVQYVQLSRGAKHTVLYCYGAGGSSYNVTLFQAFTASHPDLSIICVERWTQGPEASKSGPDLLSALSAITIELLDTLKVDRVSIVAHSAGAYQALDLANRYASRVKRVFPACAHIPYPYTASKVMSYMCNMPGFLFYGVTKLDQLSDTPAEKIFLRLIGSKKSDSTDYETFMDTKEVKETLDSHKLDEKQVALKKERLDMDYRIGYCRIPGIPIEKLVELFTNCSVDMTWFTADADLFFGPASVQRIAKDMKLAKVDVIVVPESSHPDIFMMTAVWEKIYDRVSQA